jgi:hypothetical protein
MNGGDDEEEEICDWEQQQLEPSLVWLLALSVLQTRREMLFKDTMAQFYFCMRTCIEDQTFRGYIMLKSQIFELSDA